MRTSIMIVLFFGVIQSWAQMNEPNWSVNPSDFNNSMAIVGTFKLNRELPAEEGDKIAALVNGEVRGMAQIQYEPLSDQYIAFLIIYGNQSGEAVKFMLYDADMGQTHDAYNTVNFTVNAIIGNLDRPFIWSDLELNDEADLDYYSFREVHGTVEMGDTVTVPVRHNTDLTRLKAYFNVSDDATVWVGEEEQISGKTKNDFTDPIEYTILSEDGQNSNIFWVKLVDAKRKVEVYPNPGRDKVHIRSDDEDDHFNIEFVTIRDMSGRVIKKNIYIDNNTLYVSDLEKGIYTMEFKLFDQVITLKFIKS